MLLASPKFFGVDCGEELTYKVMSMKEVEKLRGSNGYSMVSTFSGCGGACLGYEMAGFNVLWANEFIAEARETYSANHPGVILDGNDIRNVTADEILKTINLKRGELDFLEGSPPCSPFSTAGKLDKLWGKVKQYSDSEQRADDLFFEFTRLVDEIQPKVFAAENVSGLVKGKAVGYFRQILRTLRASGYQVEARLLDASYLGVPQARQRIIFIGVRNDLGITPKFPQPKNKRFTVQDVLDSVRQIEETNGDYLDPETNSSIGLAKYAVGNEWDKTKIGESSEKYFQLVKPALDKPVGTITATAGVVGAASVAHPLQKRKFTLEELRALSSFPADFILTGTYQQRAERIGRSVPPYMAKAIGEVIAKEILGVYYASRATS